MRRLEQLAHYVIYEPAKYMRESTGNDNKIKSKESEDHHGWDLARFTGEPQAKKCKLQQYEVRATANQQGAEPPLPRRASSAHEMYGALSAVGAGGRSAAVHLECLSSN